MKGNENHGKKYHSAGKASMVKSLVADEYNDVVAIVDDLEASCSVV